MRNIVLVIDWSNIAFRSLYMAQGFGKVCRYDAQEEIESYIGKMAQDISYILRIFMPNKVIFAADSKHSWRKDILDTYKSNREKDDKHNWVNIFNALDEFKEHLKSLGFVFAEAEHAEADDLMALTKEIIFNSSEFSNYNIILVSADADIRQLIDFNIDTKQYVMVFNEIGKGPGGKRHLYCNQDIMDWYNEKPAVNDIFFSGIDSDKTYIADILKANQKIEIEVTEPENILLSKIFCGDDGDAVPAFYEWYNNKGKKVRITNSKFKAIVANLGIENVNGLDFKKNSLKETIESVIKKEINDIDVIKRLERQKKLVELHSSQFPKQIVDYKEKLANDFKSQPKLNLIGVNMKRLIEGSNFSNILIKDKKKNADIFKGMGKYIDNLDKLWD